MSEQQSFQERTEDPTPKRKLDARKKGTVLRSRELTTTVVMMSGSALLLLGGAPIAAMLVRILEGSFSVPRAQLHDPDFIPFHFSNVALIALQGLAPLFLVLSAVAIFGSVALGGWSFSPKALGFKLERISILKGLKRVFGVRGLIELLKSVAKFGFIATVAVFWLQHLSGQITALSYEPSQSALIHAAGICAQTLLIMSMTLILIAAIDVPFQIWHHTKNLRMTRQEVRDEQKDSDGKPEVKSRIRMLQQQLATRRMMEAVPEASVVITNPTHFAVAIKYDSKDMSAPTVVAKGKDKIAERIREIAAQNDVTLFSAPPLARVLYRTTKIGQQIPYELYKAVAQVLAYVFQLRDRTSYSDRELLAPDLDVDESMFPGSAGGKE